MRNYRRKGEELSDKVEFRLSERDKNKRNDWKTVLHAAPEEKCHTNLPSHTCILAYSLILSQIGQEANVKGRVTTFDTPPFSFAGDKQLTFSGTAPYIVREFQLLSRDCSVPFFSTRRQGAADRSRSQRKCHCGLQMILFCTS